MSIEGPLRRARRAAIVRAATDSGQFLFTGSAAGV